MVSNASAPAGIRPPIHLLDSQSDLLGNLALMAEHRIPVVSAMLLTEIERNEDRLRLGGETRELTLLFADVRNFTSLSDAI